MLMRLAIAAATAAAALGLLACGGSGNAPARAAASEKAAEQSAEVKFQDFARCLREHGIQAEAQTHGLKVNGGSEAAMKAAEAACARLRPAEQKGPNRMSAQEKVAQEESLRAFAKCMREHGVDVEVGLSGGLPDLNVHGGGGAPNPESPAFKAAQGACSKLLPKLGAHRVGAGGS
jgi:hypothetical protein